MQYIEGFVINTPGLHIETRAHMTQSDIRT